MNYLQQLGISSDVGCGELVLDGDGCKVRNGLATIEGDSDLDTSIACDSCDIW